MIAINGVPNHIHLLIGLNPDVSISALVQETKRCSTNYINENKFVTGKFNWQKGYGAFSYSKSSIDKVVNYILNQEIHHKKKTFKEEYIELLEKFDIEYNEKY
jgi:putative transposase